MKFTQDWVEELYSGTADDEIGSVQDFGWYGLYYNASPEGDTVIIKEDTYGNIDYCEYPHAVDATRDWHAVVEDAEKFYAGRY